MSRYSRHRYDRYSLYPQSKSKGERIADAAKTQAALEKKGVKLVEEVEKRKLVYNLAENYPFSAANMWLANRWREGLFGELMKGRNEIVIAQRTNNGQAWGFMASATNL